MCPKKLELDNRSKKTPLVHRFMTPPKETVPPEEIPASAEEKTPSPEKKSLSEDTGGNNIAEPLPEIISVDPVEVIPLPSYDAPPDIEAVKEEIVPELTSAPVKEKETASIPVSPDINNTTAVKAAENAEVDYKKFITPVQDKIDVLTNTGVHIQEDMKAQLKASLKEELIKELKNELKNELREEIAAKEKADKVKETSKESSKDKVELKFVREPIKTSQPVKNVPALTIEKTGEARYMFRNPMEDIVAEEVAGILKNEKNMCKCSRCMNDICAIVLNALPPHYVTSEVGQLYDRAGLLDITKSNKLTVNIFKAIDHVKKSPAHPV